jgi:hypothetical protein
VVIEAALFRMAAGVSFRALLAGECAMQGRIGVDSRVFFGNDMLGGKLALTTNGLAVRFLLGDTLLALVTEVEPSGSGSVGGTDLEAAMAVYNNLSLIPMLRRLQFPSHAAAATRPHESNSSAATSWRALIKAS